MEDWGVILFQISSFKNTIDKVNEEFEQTVERTREIESEIIKCFEIENVCLSRENDLIKMVSVGEFQLNGLIQVAASGETSLHTLERELRNLKINMDETRGRISAKREEFIEMCDNFQNDMLKGDSEELNVLLLEKEALQNERDNLHMKFRTVQNSTKEYLEEIFEEIHGSSSALEAELQHKNSRRKELLKDICDLKLLLHSVSSSDDSSFSLDCRLKNLIAD